MKQEVLRAVCRLQNALSAFQMLGVLSSGQELASPVYVWENRSKRVYGSCFQKQSLVLRLCLFGAKLYFWHVCRTKSNCSLV